MSIQMSPRKSNGVELNGSELNRNGSELNRNGSELNRNNDPSKSWFHNLNLNQMWLTNKFILTMPFSLAYFFPIVLQQLFVINERWYTQSCENTKIIHPSNYAFVFTVLKLTLNEKTFCKKKSRWLTISKNYMEYFFIII